MKLDALLKQLESLRVRCEEPNEDYSEIAKMEIILLLVNYINNQQLREKIDEISF